MINKFISLVLLILFLTTGYSYSIDQFLFPKKKPSVFKKIQINTETGNSNNLPQRKPIIKTEGEKNKRINDIQVEKEEIKIKKKDIVKEKDIKLSKKINFFLLPQKKPITYKVQSKDVEKSTILKQKDFERAKETIKFIKARKWNSALKSAKKVKDRDLKR